ncbi:MAG TPA: hemerythrin domain-containing protein [Negativicutes bacterium]|jgi:hemerythrin
MDISNLLRQHQEVLGTAAKISAYQNQQQVKDSAFEISMLLGQLSGKIKMHLASEDQFVYPNLMKHQDIHIRNTCEKFASEMGDLAKVFEEYKTRYLGASKIADNPDAFLADTKNVFAALAERIQRENKSLYTLLT